MSPLALADEVLSRMTVYQKAETVVLSTHGHLENANIAIPSLCLPRLTMSDGSNGLAIGLTGVTQLPASISVASSFNLSLARAAGHLLGSEARTKGISAVQGPELNLARIPMSGRIFESYGEDPYLTSVMGVANIQGIQSTGVMANAKHFSAYTQETARARLNQVVPLRALAEIYNAPFQAAVQQGHVASLMCSYGELNGVNTCSSPYLYGVLHSWGFKGFVRSDLRAVKNVARAFRAGLALVKPSSPRVIATLVRRKLIPIADLNRAVRSVLFEMFSFGIIAKPPRVALSAQAGSPSHANTALLAAQSGTVLLKNSRGLLPLSRNAGSVAVIGTDASLHPSTAGEGSAEVKAPYIITPLQGIRSAFGQRTRISYRVGGPVTLDFDRLNGVAVVRGTPLQLITPLTHHGPPGKSDINIDLAPNVNPAVATATKPGTGAGWLKWQLETRANKTGTFEVSIQQLGDTWLYLNGRQIIASRGLHAPGDETATVALVAGHHYTFSARWFQIRNHPAPKFGIADVTPMIDAAVAAARRARTAIVFVGDTTSEGIDRASLNLPGDANALISAVAAANPRTIVVLNTGGAVLMPWLDRVAGVVEAWYPGQEDGTAIASILDGAFDPSARLPITFPASSSAMPATTSSSFPGVNSTVDFGTGLAIGYRWYQATRTRPLFPFGFGLDYTLFSLSAVTAHTTSSGVIVQATVTNVGTRRGADVVQAYVHYPSSTGEPPDLLRAFARVDLAPSGSSRVSMTIRPGGFQIFRHGALRTVAGQYRIDVGESSANLPFHLSLRLP